MAASCNLIGIAPPSEWARSVLHAAPDGTARQDLRRAVGSRTGALLRLRPPIRAGAIERPKAYLLRFRWLPF